jgi:hypothetical protein
MLIFQKWDKQFMKNTRKNRQVRKKVNEEPLDKSTIEAAWNNPKDEKASEFYKKKRR